MTDYTDLVNRLDDDQYWDNLCKTEDVAVLEELVADIKVELADIDEERVLRRAEWSEYATIDHDTLEFRQAKADFDRWKADIFVQARKLGNRKAQLIAAMRNKIGQGGGSTARTIIARLVRGIKKYEDDVEAAEEDLFDLLDSTWFVAQGRRWNLREFAEAGFPW